MNGVRAVLTAGFPGTPAYVYENPGKAAHAGHWPKHQVFDRVSNEAPQFTDVDGDDRPELVCTRLGFFGYFTFDPAKPFAEGKFHAISDRVAPVPFGHGLGVGDVDGDGRKDILMKDGWFRQPASLADDQKWQFNKVRFAKAGGAEMYAYDVDGDGDNDVITSLAAHDFGLAWYEQIRDGDKVTFKQHLIMGDSPAQNRYGVVFSELHSVALADIDGDGLKDIVTGKTYYSHHQKSPMWDAGAVVYWFRLTRTKDGVDFVPHKADGESGIGRQLTVADLDNDGLPDLLAGGMKGGHVLRHRRETVDEKRWQEAQPRVVNPNPEPALTLEPTFHVKDAIEAETMTVLRATAGKASRQEMSGFKASRWSGDAQLFWSGGKVGDKLELQLPVAADGEYTIAANFTLAKDFAIVRLWLDDQPLGEPLDLYNAPDVTSTGEREVGARTLKAGDHRLTLEITGANPAAPQTYRVGLDYVRLIPRR